MSGGLPRRRHLWFQQPGEICTYGCFWTPGTACPALPLLSSPFGYKKSFNKLLASSPQHQLLLSIKSFLDKWRRLELMGAAAAAAAKSLQSCPTLCDPIDSSLSGSPVPGILQARTLEWVAISLSNAWKWKVKSESKVAQSCPTLSDPMDCSPPGSSIHGIFQARVLEWGAIAFSLWVLIHTNYQ